MNSRRIHIFDTTLRDGEQAPGCQLTLSSKLAIAEELDHMGMDIIEAGFPISSPGDFLAVQQIAQLVRRARVCALARTKEQDIDMVRDALQKARNPRIQLGIGSSDIHIKHKFNSTREKILEIAFQAVKYARNQVAEVQFFAEDAGRADNEYLAKMVETVIAAGASIVNIPDTNGFCTPFEYYEKIKFLKENVSNMEKAILSVHCHNDLGMATSNTIAGLLAGADQAEGTINGVGERAGNAALEEVIMIIETKQDLGLSIDIDTQKIYKLSQLVAQHMQSPLQAHKAIVGTNAFAHSSGIHQDGVLKNRSNYEIIDPVTIGAPLPELVLSARSGRAALLDRLNKLGIVMDDTKFAHFYLQFLTLADQQRVVTDHDLYTLAT